MVVKVQDLVAAALYPDKEAVIQDALRCLLRARPRMRVEIAVHRYRTEPDLSLAKAASIAGVSFDQMKEVLRDRGIPLRLGPATVKEAAAEVAELEAWFNAGAG